jgi:flagellar biogenesis protein FliO
MSDLIIVVIIVGFFLVAIWVVRLLGRMIDHDTDPSAFEDEE